MCVRLSQSVLQLAVRASRQAISSHLSCLLLGSASISGSKVEPALSVTLPSHHSGHGVVVEVDRLDLGRNVGNCLQPTALVPGDVIVYCTVRTLSHYLTDVCVCGSQGLLLEVH